MLPDCQGIYHLSCSGEALSRAQIADEILQEYRRLSIQTVRESLEHEAHRENLRFVLNTDRTREMLGLEQFTDSREVIKNHVLLHHKKGLL